MILELLEFVSVMGDSAQDLLCKFCYGDDEQDGWLRPCKCSGTLKWVHRGCFDQWMKKAPARQQTQCQTCRHVYEKVWVRKPWSDWSRPQIQMTTWEILEIVIDLYSTYKFIRGFIWTVEGRRSILVQGLHFLFWRTFIASNRRIAHYQSLGIVAMTSVFEMRVKDFQDPNHVEEGQVVSEHSLDRLDWQAALP